MALTIMVFGIAWKTSGVKTKFEFGPSDNLTVFWGIIHVDTWKSWFLVLFGLMVTQCAVVIGETEAKKMVQITNHAEIIDVPEFSSALELSVLRATLMSGKFVIYCLGIFAGFHRLEFFLTVILTDFSTMVVYTCVRSMPHRYGASAISSTTEEKMNIV
jgi:hypothetical protein